MRYLDRAAEKYFGKRTTFYRDAHTRRLIKTYTDGDIYRIRDAKLPKLDKADELLFFRNIFEDTFGGYVYLNDDYSGKIVDLCDGMLIEGFYGLVNDKVNVTVEPGDIVIDAGSWAGDFAAYASVKGAAVYAFEPTPSTFELLKKTADLNGNITPVNKGLSDENTSTTLFVNVQGNSGGNALRDKTTEQMTPSSSVETVRLDDFVRENNLPRVDFIKADIEGFERNMLAGAQETLARFAPKLALCTYHLPDDPEVMTRLILQANPRYNIVQKHAKLLASVPE